MSKTSLAVLSDVHGNHRALEAVLTDIGQRGIERIVNLGDCLYGPFDPRPAAEVLLGRGLPTVSGNEDRVLVRGAVGATVSRTARYTIDRLGGDAIDWLAALPPMLPLGELLLFHGTPTDDAVYLLTRAAHGRLVPRAMEEISLLLGDHRAPVVLCGHDHTPAVVGLEDGITIINPGSVGCPAYDDDVPEPHAVEVGSPHARYAIIVPREAGVRIEHVSVPYDADGAADEAQANGFPDWALWLRSGRVRAPSRPY